MTREESKVLNFENQAVSIFRSKRKKENNKPIELNSTQSSDLSPQSPDVRPQSSNLNPNNFKQICTELLRKGHKVKFHAPGNSMYPTILNGDEITVEPIKLEAIKVGDIILYRNKNSVIAHRVIHLSKKDTHHSQHSTFRPQSSDLSPHHFSILRGDAAVALDDPVSAEQILGKVTLVEREGRRIDPYSFSVKIRYKARRIAVRFKKFVFLKRN